MDLLDPERERIDLTGQAILGWCLVAATTLALASVAVDATRILRGSARLGTDWPAEALLLVVSPWLLGTGWRLAHGRLDRAALLPPWALVVAGAAIESLAVVAHQWQPHDARALRFVVLAGAGAIVLGLQRWWRSRRLSTSRHDVA